MQHKLKILPPFFEAVQCGDKTFEVRNDMDRGFQKGDTVILQEYDRDMPRTLGGDYTGRELERRITYVTSYEQKSGFVVFGMADV